MVIKNSSSVQNIKKNSIATTAYLYQHSCKYYKIPKIIKQDRQEKQKFYDIKELQRGITKTVLIP